MSSAEMPSDGTSNSSSGCPVSGEALYCGGEGFTAARLDSATGTVSWRFDARIGSSAPVMVRDEIVVLNDMEP